MSQGIDEDKTELWPLDRLVPSKRNARTHSPQQIDQLMRIIDEFGFLDPILTDEKGNIIAGHGRLVAAQRLGLETVRVLVVDRLTPKQKRALMLAHNQVALQAGWDEELLSEELKDLEAEGFDLNLLAFDPEDLGKIMGGEFEGVEDEPEEELEDEPMDRGVALAIVLTPAEMGQWRQAKAEIGYSTDKSAFWKLVQDFLQEIQVNG